MQKIELWKEAYRIGNEVIDAQHEELFHRIEKLLELAHSADLEDNRKQCEQMLDYLADYTNFHFSAEEKLQKDMGYPGLAEHQKKHEEFKQNLKELEE